jgi:Membrane protease subunits, stomatin/prohibitin homologs
VENQPISAHARFKRWIRGKLPLVVVSTLITLLVVIFFFNRIVIIIHSGQAGVLYRMFGGGTETDTIYAEGIHIINPFNTMYLYEVRKQLARHEFDVITNKGLSIHLSLAVRYRPEYELLGILHQRIGSDYLNRVILPQIESVMRKQLGSYTAEQIYTNEEGLLTNAILSALDEVGRNYVEVEDIIIRSIALPPEIVTAIEDKLKQEEFMKSYEFRLQTAEKEAARLAVEAGGIKTYHDTINASLTEQILRNQGIKATEELAKSANAKVVVIGSGKDGLPIILGGDHGVSTPAPTAPANNADKTTEPPAPATPPDKQKPDKKLEKLTPETPPQAEKGSRP